MGRSRETGRSGGTLRYYFPYSVLACATAADAAAGAVVVDVDVVVVVVVAAE